jgi:GxxExxY protein
MCRTSTLGNSLCPTSTHSGELQRCEGRLDLLVEDRLVVELKAVETLAPIHRAQVLSYLKATNLQLGLLINFNAPILKDNIKRVILS